MVSLQCILVIAKQFALVDYDTSENKIVNTEMKTPPQHEPGVLPKWLHEEQANFIIAGGMGTRAQDLFAQNDIKVIVGAPVAKPEELVLGPC